MMEQYLALLRGINVGGNNIIKMTDLKPCFENMDFKEVTTVIQSGNVIFNSPEKNETNLVQKIEKTLSYRFNYKALIVIINHNRLRKIVSDAPKDFGKDADQYRYDVLFLKEHLVSKEAQKSIKLKDGVDTVAAGETVLYFSRLISRAAQSYLTRLITLPLYQQMTIRNWNTTTRLLDLMDKRKNTQNT